MRRELFRRYRVDVEYCYVVTSRNLFQPSTELNDLLLVLLSHWPLYSRRTRNVGQIRYHDFSMGLFLERAENLFVVFGKLVQRQTMSNVVNTNTNRHEVRIQCCALLQLIAQHISSCCPTYAKVRQPRIRPPFDNAFEKTRHITTFPRTHAR